MENKKEKEDKSLSEKLFKVLLIAVFLVFSFIIIRQPSGSFSFSENKLREPTSKQTKRVDTRPTKSVPGELKWTDPFKGISNENSSEKKGFMD
ncbi:hypothetical protein ACH5BF_08370 [Arcobacter sp. YIC-464]|uniref:hypothetical protein n=1 Tax=Arcobacter sp. YIC-464 TaxID=3376631 RepID=UPI003C15A8AB